MWSVCHFAAGVILGFNLGAQDVHFLPFLCTTLCIGYGWEVVESGIERWLPKLVKHPEGPLNRWVSDPLMVTIGALLGFWLVGLQ